MDFPIIFMKASFLSWTVKNANALFRLTALAKQDLKRIAVFTEHNWDTEQRNNHLSQFDQTFHKLTENPSLGNACDYIRTGYRKFPQGSHLISYRMGVSAQ